MEARLALVTGAGGEMGHLLLPALRAQGYEIVAFDIHALDPAVAACCRQSITGNVTDRKLLEGVFDEHRFTAIFHLAALLSSKAERDPDLAHEVNVSATLRL